jgi:hypothetical protein
MGATYYAANPGNAASPRQWSDAPFRIIAAIALIDAIWLAATPISLKDSSLLVLVGIAMVVPLGLWLGGKAARFPRIQTLIVGGVLMLAAWPALRLFNHLTMSTGFPLADPWLAAADRAMGFSWLGYLSWLDRHPDLLYPMKLLYRRLSEYSAATFVILALGRNAQKHCAEYFRLFLGTALTCSTLGMFVPAVAAAVYYAPAADRFANLQASVGGYHLRALMKLRWDPFVQLNLDHMPGLITMPSFHTAMGVIGIYCCRHHWLLFTLSLAVNLGMIAGTPLYGSHYAVDIVAGAAVAGVVIAVFREDVRTAVASFFARQRRGMMPSVALVPSLASGPLRTAD